jgi:hypothetical protein
MNVHARSIVNPSNIMLITITTCVVVITCTTITDQVWLPRTEHRWKSGTPLGTALGDVLSNGDENLASSCSKEDAGRQGATAEPMMVVVASAGCQVVMNIRLVMALKPVGGGRKERWAVTHCRWAGPI